MGDTIDWLLSLTGQAEDWILGVADAWWVHLVVYLFAAGDGFFPSVPSESTIVTLSSLWSSSGRPSIVFLGLAAWLGAWTGDNIGYFIGSKVGADRFRFLREGKGRTAVEAAERGLQKRALVFLMTARYIPFGRTAVNLVAGAVRYPHKNFWPRSLLSTFVWALYSCAIGAIAGAWFADHHLLAITVALIAAVVMALLVERLIAVLHRALDRRAERREKEARGDGEAHEEEGPRGEASARGEAETRQEGETPRDETGRHVGPAATGTSHHADSTAASGSTEESHEMPQTVAAGAESPLSPARGEDSPA